jgi:hypothetical protein
MADGDEIHAKLPRRYQNSYADVCSPGFNPEATAHGIAGVVLEDVRDFGNAPIDFLKDAATELATQLPDEPLLKATVDYGAVQQQIEDMARRYPGSPKAIELAKRTLRREVESYRGGESFSDATTAVQGYLMNIHEARFTDSVPLTRQHLNNLSHDAVNQRMEMMRPHAQREYDHLARSIVRRGDVNRRIHRRRFNSGLGLHDEVF